MIIPFPFRRIRLLLPKRFICFSAPLTACVLIFSFCVPLAYAQMQNFKDVYERAVNAYNKEQYDQALDLYQQLIKAAPGFAPAYNGLALTIQASSGDQDKTIEYLKMAVGYDPKMTEAYVNLGRIYFGRQDFDPAEAYFEKALKLDPNLTSAQLSLAWINLLVRSKPLKALKYFKQVLRASQDPKIYFGMGSAYFASNQRSKALDMITQLRSLKAEDLASQLEASMRKDPWINTPQMDTSVNNNAPSNPGLGPVDPTPDKPTGMQARLRGKLSDY